MKTPVYHNPANVSETKIPEGARFCLVDEIDNPPQDAEVWVGSVYNSFEKRDAYYRYTPLCRNSTFITFQPLPPEYQESQPTPETVPVQPKVDEIWIDSYGAEHLVIYTTYKEPASILTIRESPFGIPHLYTWTPALINGSLGDQLKLVGKKPNLPPILETPKFIWEAIDFDGGVHHFTIQPTYNPDGYWVISENSECCFVGKHPTPLKFDASSSLRPINRE